MSFLWPNMLCLLALLPLLVLLYLWILRRRRKAPVRLASIAIAKLAAGKGPGWRRHVPPLVMLAGAGRAAGGHGAAHGDDHAAAVRAHHHPGHGRLGQHACRRRQAQPPGGQRRKRPRPSSPSCRAR